jgi:tellurite methyltransferase
MDNSNLVAYKTLPVWTAATLPDSFKQPHNTQQGTWAKLHILRGYLNLAILDAAGNMTEEYQFNTNRQPPLIQPQQWHKICSVSTDIQCQLTFYCYKEDYCAKKYALTANHSEVIAAAARVKPGSVLDLGCGAGRNALYLNMLGFDVTAVDKNEPNINRLNQIINQEHLNNFCALVYDINQADITGSYDLIISTVVMMFLQPQRIPAIIHNMQSNTRSGGYNVIVSAMSTPDYPCSMPFPFTFQENELRHYYQNWHIIEYNENIGTLHKTDSNGNRLQLRFATLHARKP